MIQCWQTVVTYLFHLSASAESGYIASTEAACVPVQVSSVKIQLVKHFHKRSGHLFLISNLFRHGQCLTWEMCKHFHILCWKSEVSKEGTHIPKYALGGKLWRREHEYEQPYLCQDSLWRILSCLLNVRFPFREEIEDGKRTSQWICLTSQSLFWSSSCLCCSVLCSGTPVFFSLGSHAFHRVKISWLCTGKEVDSKGSSYVFVRRDI